MSGVQSLASAVPVSSVMQVAQVAAQPASMMLGPLMQLGGTANAGTAGLAGRRRGRVWLMRRSLSVMSIR
ncbi:hypothetical protein BZL30_3279 [Mycobacterium kansasii]|uniref:Uncharacterized protein n=1 Tax=Mycobacterium kansasii TaxID=1768 RepID=A0A1V3X807_MYCKA|nr:hypothetical protein BZL30_3279 [Mycobacterium kansasii]